MATKQDGSEGIFSWDEQSTISVLVVNIDFYMSRISVNAEYGPMPKGILMPVIRIYGSTALGQRACVHIHGFLPYIYFRADNFSHAAFENEEKLRRLLPVLESSIEELMHMRRVAKIGETNKQGQPVSKRKHLNKLEIVKKKSIYGMWIEPILFIKAYLYDPGDITRLAHTLDEGLLAGIQMQTFESHIPYILKFTSDYNISPMGWIHLSRVKFRPPLPDISIFKSEKGVNGIDDGKTFTSPSKPTSQWFSPLSPAKASKHFTYDGKSTTPVLSGYFTQSTVPTEMVWAKIQNKEEEQCNSEDFMIINGIKVKGLISEDLIELFDGLKPEDLVWTQPATVLTTHKDVINALTTVINPALPSKPISKYNNNRVKESTCELELDVHEVHIVNKLMKRVAFGAELWEEEKLRCEKKGLPPDELPNPPFSQTNHRGLQPSELEFRQRLKRLQKKGMTLKRMSTSFVRGCKESGDPEDVAEKLSQYLDPEFRSSGSRNLNIGVDEMIDHRDENSYEPLKRTPLRRSFLHDRLETGLSPQSNSVNDIHDDDQELRSWAADVIRQTIQSKDLDSECLSLDNTRVDSELIVEEYLKSQMTQYASMGSSVHAHNADLIRNTPKRTESILGSGEKDNGDEEDQTQEDIEKETLDILTSTQVNDLGVDHPQDTKERLNHSVCLHDMDTTKDKNISPSVGIVDLTSPPAQNLLLRIDEKVIAYNSKSENEKILQASWTYSTPPSEIPSQNVCSMNNASVVEPIDHASLVSMQNTKLNSVSGIAESVEVEQYETLIPSIKKRSNDLNRLTSAFKKRKLSNGKNDHGSVEGNSLGVRFAESPSHNHGKDFFPPKRSVMFADFPTNESSGVPPGPYIESEKRIPCLDNTQVDIVGPLQSSMSDTFVSQNVHHSPSMYVQSPELQSLETHDRCVSPTLVTSAANQVTSPIFSIAAKKVESVVSTVLNQPLVLFPTFFPPKRSKLKDLMEFNLPRVINRPAVYSDSNDVPTSRASAAYAAYMLEKHPVKYEHDNDYFDGGYPGSALSNVSNYVNTPNVITSDSIATMNSTSHLQYPRWRCLIPTFQPPICSLPSKIEYHPATKIALDQNTSQIATPTQTAHSLENTSSSDPGIANCTNKIGDGAKDLNKMQRIVTMSMELFCITRKDLRPNPKYDAIQVICWIVDDVMTNAESEISNRITGMVVSTGGLLSKVNSAVKNVTKQQHSNLTKRSEEVPVQTKSINPSIDDVDTAKYPLQSVEGVILATPPALCNNIDAPTTVSPLNSLQEEVRNSIYSCFTNTSASDLQNIPKTTHLTMVENEQELFQKFIDIVRDIDPDFITGYENQHQSFGYFIRRGKNIQITNILQLLSRIPLERPSFRNSYEFSGEVGKAAGDINISKGNGDGGNGNSGEGVDGAIDAGDPGIYITGRTLLNVWQIMRSEVKLCNSSLPYVVEEVLHKRIPVFTSQQLTRWFKSSTSRFRTISFLHTLTVANLLLLEKLDLMRKISESARLYGIDFYSVLHRGSQYRVEAALLLKAHALDYVLLSPSKYKVAAQAAMEVIPLVMEPESGFYADPVLVLDFQSLYPSMMIAYNLCFSTCLGKLLPGSGKISEKGSTTNLKNPMEDISFEGEDVIFPSPTQDSRFNAKLNTNPTYGDGETTGKLGVISYPEPISAINATIHIHSDNIQSGRGGSTSSIGAPYVSPNGSVFCSKDVRPGILPMMVKEMLNTRIMIKRSMKRHCGSNGSGSSSKVLEKVLDARQLAVKLLSNVTYGYAAAGFSGRMPMAELADAIVQSGRSTLEWTMHFINNHPAWKAKVIYGDTDSVFVQLPGRSLDDAFVIGDEIAKEITCRQPEDVVLKFEKVYYPCILLTKKRYVGRCFEPPYIPQQTKAHLDAKGIEMIRRDQCFVVKKLQEKVLRLLFETRDLSLCKSYLHRQYQKILMTSGHHSDSLLLDDFIFYKEVKFGYYASVSSQPPGAIVATKAVLHDEMEVPPYNWRVPYLVVQGLPNAPLKNLVYDPKEILKRGSSLRLNVIYYLTKCINPALDRVLSLCGVDVAGWYREVSRPKMKIRHINYETNPLVLQYHPPQLQQAQRLQLGNGISSFFFDQKRQQQQRQQTTMDRFTTQTKCELCPNDAMPQRNLCHECFEQPLDSLVVLMQRLNMTKEKEKHLESICQACAHFHQESLLFVKNEMIGPNACESIECPIFHERNRLVMRIEDFMIATHDIQQL